MIPQYPETQLRQIRFGLLCHLHDHGAANVNQKVESRLVREERVPYPEHVGKRKLLGEQQRDPPEITIVQSFASATNAPDLKL
jgi:hypothetical protein